MGDLTDEEVAKQLRSRMASATEAVFSAAMVYVQFDAPQYAAWREYICALLAEVGLEPNIQTVNEIKMVASWFETRRLVAAGVEPEVLMAMFELVFGYHPSERPNNPRR